MPIDFHKSFKKSFKKMTIKQQKAFFERLELFETDPYNSLLNNHALRGAYKECRSINVTGDVRAIYTIYVVKDERILFLDIGTHSQLYG